MSRLISSLIFLVFFVGLVSKSSASSSFRYSHKHVAFFIFGDSFLDVGNNNYINTSAYQLANYWPYGETYFKLFPTGRFSDGRLVSDFIAEYAKLQMIPPFLQPGSSHNYYKGVNFASAGAGALDDTFKGLVIPLKAQLRYFNTVATSFQQNLGKFEAKLALSRAVYLFSIGSNDYSSPSLSSYTYADYVAMVVGNTTAVVQEVYKTGARKFAFMNLPIFGCLPADRISYDSCNQEASALAALHNQVLFQSLVKLEKQLKGFKYSLFDFYSSLSEIIDHPSEYGFKEEKVACCGTGRLRAIDSCGGKREVKEFELCDNPNDYVFWDTHHLTEKAYKQLAAQMWSNQTKTSNSGFNLGPYNLEDLFHATYAEDSHLELPSSVTSFVSS
ncbi:GDSL esterase/lipase [Quillaja saponaria]|uniref:GDSL esterase/lipase n=1 Tax=Quillaja saponaria TaxID=32244 RepID=A0AAD7P553_QUISA|nr:GDSL esterase/lipase [Quillaja saponaria]